MTPPRTLPQPPRNRSGAAFAARNIDRDPVVLVLSCADCEAELHRTAPMLARALVACWAHLALTALAAAASHACRFEARCLRIRDAQTAAVLQLSGVDLLLTGASAMLVGATVCACAHRQEGEVFVSDRWPAVHGLCGRWLAPPGASESAARGFRG